MQTCRVPREGRREWAGPWALALGVVVCLLPGVALAQSSTPELDTWVASGSGGVRAAVAGEGVTYSAIDPKGEVFDRYEMARVERRGPH